VSSLGSSDGVAWKGERVTPSVQGLPWDAAGTQVAVLNVALWIFSGRCVVRLPAVIEALGPNQLTLPRQRDAGDGQEQGGGKRLGGFVHRSLSVGFSLADGTTVSHSGNQYIRNYLSSN
jgi:hypothetical protein